MSDDSTIRARISELIEVEHTLRERLQRGEITEAAEHEQLRQAEIDLDRTWDLLRQRQARRDAGQNPDDAAERSAAVVENYLD